MSRSVRVTPTGRLVVEASPEAQPALPAALADGVDAAFASSSAEGLLYLVSRGLDAILPLELVYWREFGQQFFHVLCQQGESLSRTESRLLPPPAEQLEEFAADAPPMRGLEYLSAEILGRLWCELRDLAIERAVAHPQGPAGFLQEVNPVWHLLGRVTFHLAENKRDAQQPFAFLATYTHRVAGGAKLQHLPLGQAVKQYAGQKNQPRLAALLEPVRRAADESPLVRQLLDSRALFQPQAWTIGEAYRFLQEVPRLESAGLVVRVPDWWNARRPPRPQVQVRIGQKRASQLGVDSLLDFSAELALDGEPLSESERQQILQATDGLVLLRGRWIEVDGQRLQQALEHWRQLESLHGDGISFVQGMRLLAGAPLETESDEESTADWSQVVAGQWLRDTLQTLRQPAGLSALQPGADLRATLRPYQADGVRWLWFMTGLGLGACLADDMGLGKTIQVIDLLLQLKRPGAPRAAQHAKRRQNGPPGTSLLVVPASLIGNWKQELERFAPSLRVFYAHPSETDPDTLSRVAGKPKKALAGVDLVITTYGLVRRTAWLEKVAWQLVVLDEAQAIKNPSSAQTKAVKKLSGSGRIVLTGTPVENHLGDLWSLFDFCLPGLLGSASQFKQFVKRLNKDQDAAAFGSLRRLVRPYILRRLKTDPNVAPELPDKTEMCVECGLSKKQVALYERAMAELARRLKTSEGIARRGLVLSSLMQLKQICNHPAQFLNEATFVAKESGKFARLESIGTTIAQRQEKVLVFTQFRSMCDPLAEFLSGVFGQSGLVLTGNTAVRKRTELVRQFQQEAGPPFLVVSVKAGGSGLNLTAASHVIHFDRWWNPAVENQATDRAFRIGQKRNLLVHKFVCRGTVEERIDAMIREKQDLADKLLEAGSETTLTELTDAELLDFVALDLNRALADE